MSCFLQRKLMQHLAFKGEINHTLSFRRIKESWVSAWQVSLWEYLIISWCDFIHLIIIYSLLCIPWVVITVPCLKVAPLHLLCFHSSHTHLLTHTHKHTRTHTHIHWLMYTPIFFIAKLFSLSPPSKISLPSPYEEETSLIPSDRDHRLYLHPEREGSVSMFSISSLESLCVRPRSCPEPPQMSPVTASSPCTQSLFHKNNYFHKNYFWLNE